MARLDVLIGICSTETWNSDFGMSMLGLVGDFSHKYEDFDEQTMRPLKKEGSILPNMRHEIMRSAFEMGMTHLFFVDTDQVFPHYTLRQLVSWKKPVVACNIPVKKFPSTPTARQYNNDAAGKLVYSVGVAKKLEKIWRVGTGIMLIDLEPFKHIPAPWFPMKWKGEEAGYQGEDWGFCQICEQYNIPIYVDHELSREIAHVGKMRYTHDLILAGDGKPLRNLVAIK